MKTTLFLGAGASAFAEMPTTTGLIHNVQDRVAHNENWEGVMAKTLVSNILNEHNDEDVEKLYQTIREMKAAEILHKRVVGHKSRRRVILDTSLSYRNNAPTIDEGIDEVKDIDENIRALESLERAIRNTLLTSFMVKSDSVDKVVSTYDKLFESVPRDIVTTNYDNVLETYCGERELDLVNGFKRSHLGDRRIWDGERGSAWTVGENALRLVKLHGSATWEEDDNGGVSDSHNRGLRDGGDVMIYPTLGKKDYDNKIFPVLWKRFEAILAKTELLIVVGFSFRDPKISRILRSRLKRTNRKNPMRLLYVGPKDSKRDGLKELVGLDDEPLEVPVPGKCVLWNYSGDRMPYVYAYRYKFGQDATRLMKIVLEAMDELCGKTSLGPD